MLETEYDWGFRAEESDKYCKIIRNGCAWPRGKMLGGSGSINGMIYLRGTPQDFDDWEKLGNHDWDYETVLDYFKKTENNLAINALDVEFHSYGGRLKVDLYRANDTIRNMFLEAAKEFGYELVTDFNGNDRIGYANVQGTLANGVRQSTAKAFLIPNGNRTNLHVIKHAHVIKLDVDSRNWVTGVHFNYKSEKEFKAVAKKEVILSAGTINTPQILMLSGVGPKKELQRHKIKTKVDLAVGKNLQDHVYVGLFFKFTKSNETAEDPKVSLFNYLNSRSGPLAAPSTDFVGYINTKYWIDNHPDIQYMHTPYPRQSTEALQESLATKGYPKAIIKRLVNMNKKTALAMCFVILTNPKSRGEIVLRNSSPVYKPKIVPNHLAEQEDIDSLVKGIQFYAQFVNTTAFKEMGGELLRFDIEECDKFEYQSVPYWECYSRYFSSSFLHAVGTAKMGPASDPQAVVDSTLKVRGVHGLRVVDASVMPKQVSANTNAATIMIGERGADFIKEDWL